jgi:RNase H-fold protein (predicted Holliday junction resolvase)
LLQLLEKEITTAVKPYINKKMETDVIAASWILVNYLNFNADKLLLR